MSPDSLQILHQSLFGAIAAVGFGVLFNCSSAMLLQCLGAGALTLAVRTIGLDLGLSLPMASFLAALAIGIVDRAWQKAQSPRGSILAVVGCIPMIPGSLAAKALMGGFALLQSGPQDVAAAIITQENMLRVVLTMAGIGTGLAIPTLVYPIPLDRRRAP